MSQNRNISKSLCLKGKSLILKDNIKSKKTVSLCMGQNLVSKISCCFCCCFLCDMKQKSPPKPPLLSLLSEPPLGGVQRREEREGVRELPRARRFSGYDKESRGSEGLYNIKGGSNMPLRASGLSAVAFDGVCVGADKGKVKSVA